MEPGSVLKAQRMRGRVLDASTGKPIEAAHLSLLPSGPGMWSTDELGRFAFWIPIGPWHEIRVERRSYRTQTVHAEHGFLGDVRLQPLPVDNGPSEQSIELMPASQSVAPAIVTADSGHKVSGTGRAWSAWYRLGVGKAPGGYTVEKTEFWLTGDRACGAWAECRELIRSDREVLWEFRLKGHEELGAPRRTFSTGHIRVSYRAK